MNLAQKLKLFRDEKGWTQSDLARFSGVSIQSIKLYETGKDEKITVSNLKKLAAAFGKSPAEFFSDDEVRKSFVSPVRKSFVSGSLVQNQARNLSVRYFSSVAASAGYGATNDDESFSLVPVSPEFFTLVLGIPAREYDMISVRGDSMEPFLHDGDKALVERDAEPKNGDIVVANLAGELYVKKLLKDPIKGVLRLTSLNDFYPDIVVESGDLNELNVVGCVRARISMDVKIF